MDCGSVYIFGCSTYIYSGFVVNVIIMSFLFLCEQGSGEALPHEPVCPTWTFEAQVTADVPTYYVGLL